MRGRAVRMAAWLSVAVMGSALGFGSVGAAGAAVNGLDLSASRVVIVGVPGLLWGDVASGLAPQLTDLAGAGALGDMTIRAARSRTCILDGLATLGAGNRARYPAPTEDAEQSVTPLTPEQEAQQMVSLAGCGQQEQVALAGLTDVTQTVTRIAEDEGTRSFGAQPGALGEAVGCSTAIRRSSAIAVAGPTARVSILDDLPSGDQEIAAALSRCPLSLITLPDLIGTVPSVSLDGVPGTAQPTDTGQGPLLSLLGRPRAQALITLDSAIGNIRAAADSLPGDTLLLVVGISEKGASRAQLHPLIALHPDLPSGYLTSSSTGRAPYVELIDVAPTALRALGVQNPDSMVGSAIQWAGPYGDLDQGLTQLRDLNRAAVAHSGLTRTFFWTLVALAGALVAGLLVHRIRKSAVRGRVLSLAALTLSVLPASTHLANLTPWWRSPSREIVLGLSIAGYIVVLGTLALIAGGRRGPLSRLFAPERAWSGPAFVVLATTALVIGADVVLGSPMELNSLLGYNAIVAGRFVGLGNLCFGLFAVSSLMATAVLARGSRRRGGLIVAVLGVASVVLVGAAGLGRDFGGVLAIVPAFLLLGFMVTGTRLSVRRVLTIGAVTALAVSSFALLDYQRAPDDRTHLGRFVAQLFDGQAWTVVSRKAQANLDVLTGSPVTWLIPIFAVAAWLLWRDGRLRAFLATESGWRAGLIVAIVSVLIGALINDSGIAVPAIAGCVVVPVLIWLGVGWNPSKDPLVADRLPDTPTASAAPDPPRVSVNSREPTG